MGQEQSLEPDLDGIRARFESLDISNAPRQYPDMREPIDPTISYGRYMEALSQLGMSFENYRDAWSIIEWNQKHSSYGFFDGELIGTEVLLIGQSEERVKVPKIKIVQFGKHQLTITERVITLNGDDFELEIMGEHMEPTMFNGLSIKVTKHGLELKDSEKVVGDDIILPHDKLTEIIKIASIGVDLATYEVLNSL